MKKHLILLIIPLLFFSTGCEEDDTIDTVIDENLIGVWKYDEETLPDFDFYRSFSSNNRWSYWEEDLQQDQFGNWVLHYITGEQIGDYWIQDNLLFFDYDDSPNDLIMYYTVTENTLILNEEVWEKVD